MGDWEALCLGWRGREVDRTSEEEEGERKKETATTGSETSVLNHSLKTDLYGHSPLL